MVYDNASRCAIIQGCETIHARRTGLGRQRISADVPRDRGCIAGDAGNAGKLAVERTVFV